MSGLKSTLLAVAVSVAAVVIFLVVLLVPGLDEGGEAAHTASAQSFAEEELGKQAGAAVPGTISFTANAYLVDANQAEDMTKYLNLGDNLSIEDIEWSSDTGDMEVGSHGFVTVKDYGKRGTLTAVSKSDDSVRATCMVATRSKDEEFAYSVELLNGKHEQDEKTENGAVQISSFGANEQKINVFASRSAASSDSGNADAVWDDTLFYTLEDVDKEKDSDGQINSYRVEKKLFVNEENGNRMEYEVYHHPSTDRINKIVSIESIQESGELEITEYYYTDDEKVNFVYVYPDVNYTPSYASPDRDGERFLYDDDSLATWRVIKSGSQSNYAAGKKEQERLDRRGWKNITIYSDLDENLQKKFDENEQKYRDAAYNTLDKVKNYDGVSTITGHLMDASGAAIPDAAVKLKMEENEDELVEQKTDADGLYQILVPTGENTYSLSFEKAGYQDENICEIDADKDSIILSQENVSLAQDGESGRECTISFYNALERSLYDDGMAPIDDLQVIIRRGVNNRSGDSVYSGEVTGGVLQHSLPAGMYTVQMIRDGYEDSFSSLFVSEETDNSLEIFATPTLEQGEYRIVLTWDDTPEDLDSHLFAPADADSATGYHVYYIRQEAQEGNLMLDVDDTDGYGPETVTIHNLEDGQYKYYVADYTNCFANNEKSMEMSASNATVRVYGDRGLIQTFHVPVNRPGVIWEVFEIRNGTVIPSQHYYDSIGNKTWWQFDKQDE